MGEDDEFRDLERLFKDGLFAKLQGSFAFAHHPAFQRNFSHSPERSRRKSTK
tara:strand:- start:1195 stop:1350 length:156 start_codon:yes stop_codon:yes gene_type:complete